MLPLSIPKLAKKKKATIGGGLSIADTDFRGASLSVNYRAAYKPRTFPCKFLVLLVPIATQIRE